MLRLKIIFVAEADKDGVPENKKSGLRDIYLNDHDQTVDFETLSDVETTLGKNIMYFTIKRDNFCSNVIHFERIHYFIFDVEDKIQNILLIYFSPWFLSNE